MSSQNKFISFCFLFFIFFFVCLFCFLVEANNKVDAVYMHLAPTYKKNRHNGNRVSVPAFKCSIEVSVCKPFFFFFRHKLYIS